jgi:hypothetical protein
MDEKTMTDEDYDLAVGAVASFYQSKRAHLKKQVTHWIGKFMICKNENNVIRQKNKDLCALVRNYRDTEVELQRELTTLKETSGANVASLADTIRTLEGQVKELEPGVLV